MIDMSLFKKVKDRSTSPKARISLQLGRNNLARAPRQTQFSPEIRNLSSLKVASFTLVMRKTVQVGTRVHVRETDL